MTRVLVLLVLAASTGCGFNDTRYTNVDAAPPPDAGAPDAEAPDAQPGPYAIGGAVTGMWDGASIAVRLQASGVDEIKNVSANGSFTFDATLATGTSYAVSVATAPGGHTCGVTGGAGDVGTGPVTDVAVDCAGPAVAIALSAPLTWTFDAATTSYALDASVLAQQTTLTVTAPTATAVTLNATALSSGVASAPQPLAFGANTETVRVDVGAMSRTYTIGIDRGAAQIAQYVYDKASNTDAGDQLGTVVAVSGDTVAVGAPFEDSGSPASQTSNSAADAGAVYVFRRTGTAWVQEAYLKASALDVGDEFGAAVALSGDTLVVGAPFEDSAATGIGGNASDDTAADAGAVYVYRRTGSTWALEAYVKASNAEAGDDFGGSVALDGNTMVVGAYHEDGAPGDPTSNARGNSGAAYTFVRSGVTWSQQGYLKASNAAGGMYFPAALSISGNTVVAGSSNEKSCATGIDGNQADTACTAAGAAYVFVRSGSTWAQQTYVKASNTAAYDWFGAAVAVVGDIMTVSATGEDSASALNQADNTISAAGAVYVFARSGTAWSQTAYLKAASPGFQNSFGSSVSLAGDLLAVGASGQNPGGGATVLRKNGATWQIAQTLAASNGESADAFGVTGLSIDTLIVGAPAEDSLAVGVNPADTGNGPAGATTDSGAGYTFR